MFPEKTGNMAQTLGFPATHEGDPNGLRALASAWPSHAFVAIGGGNQQMKDIPYVTLPLKK